MSDKIKDLLKEGSRINVLGILIILALGVFAGVLFTTQYWWGGIILILAGGLYGMITAWRKRPKGYR